ncbi:hypothetical protein GJ496_007267 [Pomphorhynchus laevis]|nr:hypothetical protein GJ496_007267 [Pomphorhynchus laevis]
MQKEREREMSDDEAEPDEAEKKEEDKMNVDEQAEKYDEEKPENYSSIRINAVHNDTVIFQTLRRIHLVFWIAICLTVTKIAIADIKTTYNLKPLHRQSLVMIFTVSERDLFSSMLLKNANIERIFPHDRKLSGF